MWLWWSSASDLLIAGIMTWLERRVAGRVQSRIGPNRVGPLGFLQWVADGVKLLIKEDLIPGDADKPLFRFAPYPVMIGVFAAFVSLPFGQFLIAADLNVAHALPDCHHLARGRGHPHGRLGVEQQVGTARRHSLGGAARCLRSAVGGRSHVSRATSRVTVAADHYR